MEELITHCKYSESGIKQTLFKPVYKNLCFVKKEFEIVWQL
jgi:hypothetical protein